MLDESFAGGNLQESSVIKGKVVAIEKDMAVIDVGLKTEGRVALREFAGPGRESDLKVGDDVLQIAATRADFECTLPFEAVRSDEVANVALDVVLLGSPSRRFFVVNPARASLRATICRLVEAPGRLESGALLRRKGAVCIVRVVGNGH
jgi:hypothetical protein